MNRLMDGPMGRMSEMNWWMKWMDGKVDGVAE